MAKHKSAKRAASAQAEVAITKDKSPYVPQDDKLSFALDIRERNDLTPKQRQLIDILLDKNTKVVFVSGPAGTSKTFSAVYCGLKLLQNKSVSTITYVRTIVESASRSLGSLPGDESLKMEPFLIPLSEKLEEFLPKAQRERLIAEKKVRGIPVNYLRGASINAQFIVCDEAQNFDKKEMTTAITRLGKFSKIVFVADPDQSDINGKSGFMPMFDLFNDEASRAQGIHCFSFTKDDVVRSGILKYICERLESMPRGPKPEPMFPPKP